MNITKTPFLLRACALALAATLAAAPLAAAPKQSKGKAKAQVREQDRATETATTSFPSSAKPDSVTLTWTDDPATTQTIRWRTNATITTGTVAFMPGDTATFNPAAAQKTPATTQTLNTPNITNDPAINFHTATLTALAPATRYTYAVGDGTPAGWTPPQTFTTAPAPASPGKPAQPYSFIYIGDSQGGGPKWGDMMRAAVKKAPDAAFVAIAGDLVNFGLQRDTYDDFFRNAKGLFDTRSVVPTPGNHDYHGGNSRIYQSEFALRANGPKNIPPGLAYSFEYSDSLFIVLDANRNLAAQATWLEQLLHDTKATWKFVLYHQPAYDSREGRSNPEVIRQWVPIFDKYHVDLALQGHDHAYLRTYPMRDSKRVATPAEGTIYMITFSCPKHYEQAPHDYTEVGFPDVPTWQLIDITPATRTLRLRAYDASGKIRDEFTIKK